MNIEVHNPILLTGAGFTHNFGGFLANEMWALIFNSPDVQKRPSLASLLRKDFDYESVYQSVMYSKYREVQQARRSDVVHHRSRRSETFQRSALGY